MRSFPLLSSLLLALTTGLSAAEPAPARAPVELVGRVSDFQLIRDWNSYYWREDFTFHLKEDGTGKTWRILSREPTPAYDWRIGTTFTGLKVDWKSGPRVKVAGVRGVDRLPSQFHKLKLNEPNVATAFVVWVETKPGTWQEYYANNWFHKWGDQADRATYKLYAGRKAPYDIYGYINGQAAPFTREAQALIARHKGARMFHGLIRAAPGTPFGYEIELLNLVGPDKQGNGTVLFGDPKLLLPLDRKR
jgi:hypothetical protein